MKILEELVGLIAPSTCVGCGVEGSPICKGCVGVMEPFGPHCYSCGRICPDPHICDRCRRRGGLSGLWISAPYQSSAERLIHLYKFGSHRPAARRIAEIMARSLPEQVIRGCIVAPVPTATSRVRERGFDHAALLAKEVSSLIGAEYSPLLGRVGQRRQVGARRRQRLVQQLSSYRVISSKRVSGRTVLLVDDVITTGATVHSAAKVLKKSGAKRVYGLVFAKKQ